MKPNERWKLEHNWQGLILIQTAAGAHVATLEKHATPGHVAEQTARARLIAESPAMLDALREVLPLLDMAFNHEGDVFRKHHNTAVDVDGDIRAILARIDGGRADD